LTTVTSGTTSFVDTSLEPGSNYAYQLFAIGPGGRLSAGSPVARPVRPGGGEIRTEADVPVGLPNRLRLNFISEEGTAYRLESTDSLPAGAWSAAAFGIVPTGSTSAAPVDGTGGNITLYVPYDFSGPNRFFRIVEVEN
jgi:hypothetical protein